MFHWLVSSDLLMIMPSYECQGTLLMVSQQCREATSHYLSRCRASSMSPYGITNGRSQWVKSGCVLWPLTIVHYHACVKELMGAGFCYRYMVQSGYKPLSKSTTITKCHNATWQAINSLAPEKFEWNFRHVIFKLMPVTDGWSIPCEIALIWMSLDFTDYQSTLVQVMAWCRQATSHYLSQCWPRSLLPYGVTRPQWVKVPHSDGGWVA